MIKYLAEAHRTFFARIYFATLVEQSFPRNFLKALENAFKAFGGSSSLRNFHDSFLDNFLYQKLIKHFSVSFFSIYLATLVAKSFSKSSRKCIRFLRSF